MARAVAHMLYIYVLRAISGSRHAASLCSGVGIRQYDTANVICHEHMQAKKKTTHTVFQFARIVHRIVPSA